MLDGPALVGEANDDVTGQAGGMKGESDIAISAFVSHTVGHVHNGQDPDSSSGPPWSVAGGAEPDLGELGDRLRLLWIIEQVRLHRIGIGKAAELVGMAPAAFTRVLGAHGVPVIDYSAADLERELGELGVA